MILKQGDHGAAVEELQRKLAAAGYNPGKIDGDYGAKTSAAVLAFQADRSNLDDDGVAGPMTFGALDAAISRPVGVVPCEAGTWSAFQHLISIITAHPVRYGPGRGLWHNGEFIVTQGPGRLGSKTWANTLGRPYASFHCTSWTNFFLSWLLRRNEDYTHAGNIPSLFTLLESSPDVHQNPGGGPFRGYGDAVSRIVPDGSGAKRSGVPNVIDVEELLARRATLPTFIVCGQSTKRTAGWVWWHHTALFVVDHHDKHRLYRIAADGYKGAKGYSGEPMRWAEITEQNAIRYSAAVFRAYGVNTTDGTYGDKSRPVADVAFED